MYYDLALMRFESKSSLSGPLIRARTCSNQDNNERKANNQEGKTVFEFNHILCVGRSPFLYVVDPSVRNILMSNVTVSEKLIANLSFIARLVLTPQPTFVEF